MDGKIYPQITQMNADSTGLNNTSPGREDIKPGRAQRTRRPEYSSLRSLPPLRLCGSLHVTRQPSRYSLVTYWLASGMFRIRRFFASHSIRRPTRSAMLPNSTVSVIGPL